MTTLLLVWVFTIYGLSNIGVYGSILNGFRDGIEKLGNNDKFFFAPVFHFMREMMRCMMCLPTWVGFIFGIFVFSPTHYFLGVPLYFSWFLDGPLASGTTWVINSIVEWFEENRPVTEHKVTVKKEEEDKPERRFL